MSVLRDYATAVSQPTLPFDAPGMASPSLDEALRYDEVVMPDGGLRPAWRAMASLALALTPDELRRVDGEIMRFLADEGVTYVDRGTGSQPWQLDPVPLVLDAADWGRLEVGLAQRAELLNAVLADLYGPQRLLSSGVIPASIVFGHSGFARPLARPSATERQPLLLSGTDLGRDADGEWRVLADRVQAPSGLGYAMQNRRVISQVLTDLYHEDDLHRMEPYFAALRETLLSAADGLAADPRVVILTPGTHSETAFDQAFLANALGFPLVQGSDLVVRDGWVWMKPSGWPKKVPTERVDVILRRVDAEWCDPLELRSDSRLGVAGLTEAVRRGRVRLVNGLGAGVLENPALLPFMPLACELLLGEQLRLPSVTTAWCGDPDARASVLARVADGDPGLMVRPIDQPRASMAGLDAAELSARILAEPHRFVGQDLLPLSRVPVWDKEARADARPVVLRAFTLRYRSAYRPLVGGLASVREDPHGAPTTKDVWVLKADESDADQGLPDIAPIDLARTVPSLGPRALADMFWAGRYAERAEDLLRLVLVTHQQLDNLGSAAARGSDESIRVLLATLRRLAGFRSDDPEAEFRSLLLDRTRGGSAAHSVARLRESFEGVRDQLSVDTWRVFSNIDRAVRALNASPRAHRSAESASRMLTALLSLYGVTANMIRDEGWHMIEAGRFLERSLQVCHLLAATTVDRRAPRVERDILDAVLTSAESAVTHRRRFRGTVRPADTLELLLLDRDNPRSLAFALAEVRRHLAAMPASTGSTRAERLLEHLETALDATDVVDLVAGSHGRRSHLAGFLADTTTQLQHLGNAIAHQHFESGPPPVPLSDLSLVEEMGATA